jgi:HK97 family phage portal protein
MAWYNKFFTKQKSLDGVMTGGIELLSRLTAGSWSKTKMLEQYHKSLYVFACVRKIAEKVASIDMQLFQVLNSQGDSKEILSHPALDLLYKPNPFTTKSKFIQTTIINLKLTGDAFWYKVRNERGQVVELWNLRPDFVEIVKDSVEYIKEYKFTKLDGVVEHFPPEDIVHLSDPDPLDEYWGISPVRSAQVRLDTEAYASEYQRDFFLNNARPDAVLKTTGSLTDEQKADIRESFEKRHRGVGKNSKVAVFEGGLEYQQISISQKEMDYIESMRFTRDDILVAFHTPKPIVAITDDVNYANAETAMYIFLSENIKPLMESIVEQVNEMLIIPDFGESLFLDFPDPTPENRTKVLEEYANGSTNGWLLINEIRQRENLPPISGGDVLYKPLNMLPSGGLDEPEKALFRKAFIAKQNESEVRRRMKAFRGRQFLMEKFQIEEALKAHGKKTAQARLQSKKNSKGVMPTALIAGNELRLNYAIMVNKAIDRRAKKLKKEVTTQAKKQGEALIKVLNGQDLTKGIGKGTKKAIKEFFEGESKVWAEFSLPFITDYCEAAGIDAMNMVNPDKQFEITKRIQKALEKRAEQFGLGISSTTRDRITVAITDGLADGEGMVEISDRINDIYKEFPTWRSDMIARTEATAANNEGFIEAYKQSDVATHKEWINAGDDRVRDEHQDGIGVGGEIVPVDQNFSNGLPYPQEVNCRCVIGPAFLN